MISSMTGYAREQAQVPSGGITWEIRSVNHRYLEMAFRLPEALRHLEVVWRHVIAQNVTRGKLDVTLKFQPEESVAEYALNQTLLAQLNHCAQQVADSFPNAHTSVDAILNWPGVLKTQEADMEVVAAAATDVLTTTLKKLSDMRLREGNCLADFFNEHLQTMRGNVRQVTQLMPQVMKAAHQRIVERFAELKLELDPTRLEQELVWLAQKIDVTEELKRLSWHMDEFEQTIERGGVVGRRLDFLAQELNREANTLASKSIDASVTHVAVELKVLIEQIREQVQNIE